VLLWFLKKKGVTIVVVIKNNHFLFILCSSPQFKLLLLCQVTG